MCYNSSEMEIFRDIRVRILEDDVLHRHGLGTHGTAASAHVSKLVSQAIEEGYSLAEPQAVYDEMLAHLTEEGKVVLATGAVLDNPHAGQDWQGLERVALAICTIGSKLEERVSKLFAEGDPAAALILDTAASVAVGSISRQIDTMTCQRAQEWGMVAGPRFSPGSVDWSLTDQKVLFSLLPADKIGVSLNEHLLMVPRKSVSFVIGMGSGVPVPKARRPCWYCERLDCPSREPGVDVIV